VELLGAEELVWWRDHVMFLTTTTNALGLQQSMETVQRQAERQLSNDETKIVSVSHAVSGYSTAGIIVSTAIHYQTRENAWKGKPA
jgi:hypothetical protein